MFAEDSATFVARIRRRTAISIIALSLLVAGGAVFASGAYLYTKAHVGQWLLHRAWTQMQATGNATRPWPWADTRPVARLIAPKQRVDLLVLAGGSGRTLAWGPGHLDGSAAAGLPGNAVLSAHRDTHFRFLARVAIGDRLIIERADGRHIAYRIRDITIADARTLTITRDTERPTLTLVTCYPFDELVPGGPLRYVVTAEAEAPASIDAQGPERIGPVDGNVLVASISAPLTVRTRPGSREGRLLPVRYSFG
ncbi:MAG TPA: class GN sortase [Casimicrobiaceae bacterium]|jgi:sortase A